MGTIIISGIPKARDLYVRIYTTTNSSGIPSADCSLATIQTAREGTLNVRESGNWEREICEGIQGFASWLSDTLKSSILRFLDPH